MVATIVPIRTLPEPSGFTATANGSYAVLVWDALSADYLQTEVRYRSPIDPTWLAWPVAEDASSARLGPFDVGYSYEFQVRTRSDTTGRVTAWSDSMYALIGTDWIKVGDGVGATVDLDFENNLYFQRSSSAYTPDLATMAAIITVTRSSTAYAESTAGVWTSFSANVPRRTDKGLLVEAGKTNSLRNNSMQGAVAGSPGTIPTNWVHSAAAGLTRTIVGTGTQNGIDYIDVRYSGTSSGTAFSLAFEGTQQIAAAVGQVWAGSCFVALVGGTLANVTSVRIQTVENDAGGAALATGSSADFSGALSATMGRQSLVYTLVAAVAYVQPQIAIDIANSSAIDLTVRLGWPQIERGEFVSSPIRTTSAAVARTADNVSLASAPTIGSGYSFFGDCTPNSLSPTIGQVIAEINDATDTNRVSIRRGSATPIAMMSINATSAVNISDGSWPNATRAKCAGAYAVSDQSLVLDGGTVTTGSSALAPTGLATVLIGRNNPASQYWDGYLQRVALWPATRVSAAGLQALTA